VYNEHSLFELAHHPGKCTIPTYDVISFSIHTFLLSFEPFMELCMQALSGYLYRYNGYATVSFASTYVFKNGIRQKTLKASIKLEEA
jgi:hypothetical protein